MKSGDICIRLRAYDHRVVDDSSSEIVDTVKSTGATAVVVPLPTRKEKYTVLCSPHKNNKSREQFEIRKHTRLIIIRPTPQTVTALTNLALLSGVHAEVKLYSGSIV
jgi:small subunit ribosomal protein S10